MLLILAAINWSAVGPLLGAFLGPIFTYLVAARRFSGRISNSDAASLWEESGKLRAEYKEEMNELRLITTRLRERVEDLEDKNESLYMENGELRKEVSRLKQENRLLKARIEELEREHSESQSPKNSI
jgi:chromosome segregation ATPase